jgi:hypothetical protein
MARLLVPVVPLLSKDLPVYAMVAGVPEKLAKKLV